MSEILVASGIFLGICLVLFMLFAWTINYVFDRGTHKATHKFLARLGGISLVAWIVFGISRLIS